MIFFIRQLDPREARVLQEDRETNYLGVYFKGERIGYVKSRLTHAKDGYRLSENALLHLNILGDTHAVEMLVNAGLTQDLLLKNFTFQLVSPFYRRASGLVTGRDIHLTITTAPFQGNTRSH